MATMFVASCDIGQGYNFKQDEHQTFGYINSLAIGENDIAPDIKVVEPSILNAASTNNTTTPTTTNTSGVFNKPVVAVLEEVSWSTLPNENITFKGRISVANSQQLNMILMQSLKQVVVTISFVVYKYDLVNQKYFTNFMSYAGTAPSSVKTSNPGDTGFGIDATKPIYALLGKTSSTAFGIKLGSKAEEDPIGIKNYTLELTLAPPIAKAPQQIIIQTSATIKLVQPWGLPQRQ